PTAPLTITKARKLRALNSDENGQDRLTGALFGDIVNVDRNSQDLWRNAMKLSTRARYGIHAMYDLAQNYGAQPRPIKAVAEAQAIPEAYLEQLLCTLRRAGLVVSA